MTRSSFLLPLLILTGLWSLPIGEEYVSNAGATQTLTLGLYPVFGQRVMPAVITE